MNARLSLLVALALTAAAAIGAPSAHAIAAVHDITVDTTSDETTPGGTTSLREAVQTANADASSDIYNIHLPAGTYPLNSDLEISNNNGAVNILGAGARTTIVRSRGAHPVFTLDPSPHKSEFDDLTITGGTTFPGTDGGGIWNSRPLDLHRVTVSGNTAQRGGGIANHGGLGLFNSTVSGNSATLQDATKDTGGGGIYSDAGIYVVNSTISGNSVAGNASHPARGGGVLNAPGAPDGTIYFSTFDDNSVTGSGADGRDIAASGSHGETVNSNIFDSEPHGGAASGEPHNCAGDYGSGASGSHTLDSGDTCGSAAHDDPKLQPLANNGGPTDTQALPADSGAIDATGDCGLDPVNVFVDQRGLARPYSDDRKCDAGAYELQSGNDLAVAMSGAPDPVTSGSNATFTITVSATGPAGDATQPTVTTAVPAGASLVSLTSSQGSCSGLTCKLGAVTNGASATVTLVVRAGAPGSLAGSASVSGPRPETTAANNSASSSLNVIAAPPSVQPNVAAAQLSQLSLSRKRFRWRQGTGVTYRLTQASPARFAVQRKACKVKKHKKRCSWHAAGRSFSRTGKQGTNRFTFKRKLKPGSYRLMATVGASHRSAAFTILR